jgi:nucleotide-binding universal stress UspA family protein
MYILHPTDYSELSQVALVRAVAEAKAHGAQLIIMHAVDTLGPENITYGEVGSERQPDGYRRRLWEQLHQVQSPDPTIPVEYLLVEDDPVKAIVETALERDCDLIVLGSHGRDGIRRILSGSIAERVMREAPCPVLVVKLANKAKLPAHEESKLHPHSLTEEKRPGS